MKKTYPLFALLSCLVLHTSPAVFAADLNAPLRPAADLKRDPSSHPLETLALLNLKPGMQVLDLFAGAGYFSELLAQDVGPTGTVYLHNNQAYVEYVGQQLTDRLGNQRLANVKDWRKEITQLGLPATSLDAVLFVMGYHDLYHTAKDWPKIDETQLMDQLKTALKPGGYLLVIDHAATAGSGVSAAQNLHRIDVAYTRDNLVKQGFKFVSSHSFLANPADNHQLSAFDPAIRGKTDRFVLLFQKAQ
ncbi:MAG: methyltransferase domain-containing protein [Gammaproteobacteria bacterium]|jgi:predicted methyltransferase|nr:methyltransferase domain-containing protein [Gammaproteobacteria bacterium]MBU2426033.1 methyltransferase domain-containing protein [Gammaproteobacteria bacterium]